MVDLIEWSIHTYTSVSVVHKRAPSNWCLRKQWRFVFAWGWARKSDSRRRWRQTNQTVMIDYIRCPGDCYLERKGSFQVWYMFLFYDCESLNRLLLRCRPIHSHFGCFYMAVTPKNAKWMAPRWMRTHNMLTTTLSLSLPLPHHRCRLRRCSRRRRQCCRADAHFTFLIVQTEIHCFNCSQQLIRALKQR